MQTYEYNKKLGYQKRTCAVCGKTIYCCQHHIQAGSGRFHSKIIWVCDMCHAKIHNPVSFGLEASWAYENGYLVRNNFIYKKRVKKKKCTHSATIFNKEVGDFVCQFCGKVVGELRMGSGKKKKTIGKKTSVKMGYEKQNPNIIKAETMKRHYNELSLKIKRSQDPEIKKVLKARQDKLRCDMKELQNTLDIE